MISNENNYKFYIIKYKEEKNIFLNTNIYLITNNKRELRIMGNINFLYCNSIYCLEFIELDQKNIIKGFNENQEVTKAIDKIKVKKIFKCLLEFEKDELVIAKKYIHTEDIFIVLPIEFQLFSWEQCKKPKLINKLVFGWTVNTQDGPIDLLTTIDGMVKILHNHFVIKQDNNYCITSKYCNSWIKYRIIFKEVSFIVDKRFFIKNNIYKSSYIKCQNNYFENMEKYQNVIQIEPELYRVIIEYENKVFSYEVLFQEKPETFYIVQCKSGHTFFYNNVEIICFYIEDKILTILQPSIHYTGNYWLGFYENELELPFKLDKNKPQFKHTCSLHTISDLACSSEDLLDVFNTHADNAKIIKNVEKYIHSYRIYYKKVFMGILLTKGNEIRLNNIISDYDEIFTNGITYTVQYSVDKRDFLNKPLLGKFASLNSRLIAFNKDFSVEVKAISIVDSTNFNKVKPAKLNYDL